MPSYRGASHGRECLHPAKCKVQHYQKPTVGGLPSLLVSKPPIVQNKDMKQQKLPAAGLLADLKHGPVCDQGDGMAVSRDSSHVTSIAWQVVESALAGRMRQKKGNTRHVEKSTHSII